MPLLYCFHVDGLRRSETLSRDPFTTLSNLVSAFFKFSWQYIMAALNHIKASIVRFFAAISHAIVAALLHLKTSIIAFFTAIGHAIRTALLYVVTSVLSLFATI